MQGLIEEARQPIVLVVVLVIVIEISRSTDYGGDDENEDDGQSGLAKQSRWGQKGL